VNGVRLACHVVTVSTRGLSIIVQKSPNDRHVS